MSTKYTVQHTGRPFGPTETITESDWSDYSKHASRNAAFRAIEKYKAHLSPGSWDDHYRVISPDGSRSQREEWLQERHEQEYQRYYKRNLR